MKIEEGNYCNEIMIKKQKSIRKNEGICDIKEEEKTKPNND